MKRKKAKPAVQPRAMIVMQGISNEAAVQAILKNRSLTKDLKKAALNALTTHTQASITNCSFESK